MVSRKISSGDGARIGFGRRPDEKGVAGILRRDRLDLQVLGRAWRCQWIEYLGAIVRFIYSQKDERSPILHDEDRRKDQSGDIDKIPFYGLGFESGPPCRPVVERNSQLPVQNREPAEQSFRAHRSPMVGSQIGQGRRERIPPERPALTWSGGGLRNLPYPAAARRIR